jgi:hypothetical protein
VSELKMERILYAPVAADREDWLKVIDQAM